MLPDEPSIEDSLFLTLHLEFDAGPPGKGANVTQTSIGVEAKLRWPSASLDAMEKLLWPRDDLSCLMSRAQAGDKLAYSSLLRLLLPILRAYVRRQFAGRTPNDVEDVVQDVLLTLHSVRATYDQAMPVLPWVLGIAANRVAEAKRRAARLYARELLVDTPPDILTCADASSGAQSYGDVEALHHAIAKLPHGQKIAVRLVKLREMTFGEAAALSGTSPAALKAAVYRGMAALRDRLEDAHA